MTRALVLLVCAACSPSDPLLVKGAPLPASNHALTGGGAASNDVWLAASDIDGDRLVLRAEGSDDRTVQFPTGWAPSAVAFGRDLVFVVLADAGSVAVIDPGVPEGAGAREVAVTSVCDAPRGLAWDDGRDRMWVACADGALVGLDRDGDVRVEHQLEGDLRDIVALPSGEALVSRFRSAEVLRVDLDRGSLIARWPAPSRDDGRTPAVARRLVPWSEGLALLVYQAHSDGPILTTPGEGPDSDTHAYGADTESTESTLPPDCDSVVQTVLTLISPERGPILDMAVRGGVVADVLPRGTMFPNVSVVAGSSGVFIGLDPDAPCTAAPRWTGLGMPTALAAAPDGEPWLVTRDPFALVSLVSSPPPAIDHMPVPTTPLGMFHAAPLGVACASCHPDGADDGHVWQFDFGPRRTQALGGGALSGSAPFHWSGDFDTFENLFHDVAQGRMGLDVAAEPLALATWLDGVAAAPRITPTTGDTADAGRGAALFAERGCADCHAEAQIEAGLAADVGTGGTFQVPSLRRVASRPPLMHDGCAPTLLERFTDPTCGGGDRHGVTSDLPERDVAALVAFLSTL